MVQKRSISRPYSWSNLRPVIVGIIPMPNRDYASRRRWRYSEGVKDVLWETLTHVYARRCFYPGN
jgi:hypothetical protein